MNLSTSIRNQFLPAVLFLTVGYGIAAVGFAADDAKPSKLPKPAEATKTYEVKFDEIALKVPEGWQLQENLTKFKKFDFVIPPVEGDSEAAEFYVSYLGFDRSEGARQTIDEWIKEFQPEGRKAKLTEGTWPQGKYTIVDITGTYNKRVGLAVKPTRPLPDARMLAAVLTTDKEGGQYVVTLTGPNKTVMAAAKAFRDSFAADAKMEKELKLEQGSK